MHVTLIGTGNMARGIGSRVLAGGHDLTVVGKDAQRAEAVAADIGGEGIVRTAVVGDPLEGEVVVLAVYYPDARAAVERYADQLAGQGGRRHHESCQRDLRRARGAARRLRDERARGPRPGCALREGVQHHLRGPPLTKGTVAGQTLDVLIAGDDEDAKGKVAALARDGGLNPIDVGPQKRARTRSRGPAPHGSADVLGTGFASALKIVA